MNKRQLGYLSWIAKFHLNVEAIREKQQRNNRTTTVLSYIANEDATVLWIKCSHNGKDRVFKPQNFPAVRDVYSLLQGQGAHVLFLGDPNKQTMYVDPKTTGAINRLEESVLEIRYERIIEINTDVRVSK